MKLDGAGAAGFKLMSNNTVNTVDRFHDDLEVKRSCGVFTDDDEDDENEHEDANEDENEG